ncbi:MAG: recombination regulator RecX [Burkholderiales bacterium]
MSLPPPSLKGRALRCLARREHSRAELERKLARFEETPGQLAGVLGELEAKGFISAQRVADSVVHRRASQLGGQRLRQELQAKGLPPDLVAQTLGTLQQSEPERASALWQRKFGRVASTPVEQARQLRFLLTRGFSVDLVRRLVLRGAID